MKQISPHEIAVFTALAEANGWTTTAEIAKRARVAPRTARAHALKLVRLNLVEQAEVFPGHRYRLVANPSGEYFDRLAHTAEVLGVTLK